VSQTAENKAIVRRFFEEFLNAANVAVADEICAADYLLRFRTGTDRPRGRQRLLIPSVLNTCVHYFEEGAVPDPDAV
jgi:hypothetical protein